MSKTQGKVQEITPEEILAQYQNEQPVTQDDEVEEKPAEEKGE